MQKDFFLKEFNGINYIQIKLEINKIKQQTAIKGNFYFQ
jgi:hypothetical protein